MNILLVLSVVVSEPAARRAASGNRREGPQVARAPSRLKSCVEPSTSVNKNVTAIGTSAPETGGSTSPDLVSSATISRVYDPTEANGEIEPNAKAPAPINCDRFRGASASW